jgi:predicted transcriptional regulator
MYESIGIKRQPGRKLTAQALTGLCASLADIDWRLLHWLLHYPLQRADDLVVGVARWASRATVYRHLRALEARGLLESVLPKSPGTGKRLYHLSNPGLHMLAMHLDTPARELASRWWADEVGLSRWLPRLPTLLVLQDVVNGLVIHAAEAMTTQGRRPELVRWNWQRDVTHRFHYRQHRMRFFADGVLALCIRSQQSESMLEQWYGVVLLSVELNDERLMRLRLERLLCWRESPERWSCYQYMLPVLIMARSQRQRDHWQRAVEAVSRKLHLDPLAGALTCVRPCEGVQMNPWLLNWRTLSTEVPCHLQELLKPLPHEAFPLSLPLKEAYERQSRSPVVVDEVSSERSVRLSRLIVGGLESRVAQIMQDGLEEREVISLLGLRLNRCHWTILHLLLEHPLLSDEELAALLGLHRKSLRCALYELHQLGCLEPIVTKVGKRWHCCMRGLHLIAAANHMHYRSITTMRDDQAGMETSLIILRGEAWLLQHIEHTTGIYGFFACLAQSARNEVGHELCWWETGAKCERRYRVGEKWYNLRPDALSAYRVGQQQIRFWLEWDRGTMNVRDLAIKFASYAHYIASREWAKECALLPVLICIAPDIAQEVRMSRVAWTRLAHVSGLVVWTTTEVLLHEYGPRAEIWLQHIPQCSQERQPGGLLRRMIFARVSEHMMH